MTSREVVAGSRRPMIAALFLAAAVVLGGGGSPNPATELLLQLTFVAAALAWLWTPGSPSRAVSRGVWLICGLALALPLIQLVPLPPGIWTGLPGQADRAAALALVGGEGAWQPLSHSPPRTLAALLAIVPALFLFYATASFDTHGRWWMAGAVAAMAVVAAIYGAIQVSLGPLNAPSFYDQVSPTLSGFHANRNAGVDVFLIGLAAAAAFLLPSLAVPEQKRGRSTHPMRAAPRYGWIVLAGLLAVLIVAALMTASRTGILLLPLVLLGVWAILWPALAGRGLLRFAPGVAAAAVLAGVAVVALQGRNTALGSVAERFVEFDASRQELWRDAWFAASQAWPFGVGLGGGQPALIAAERLEVLDPLLPNRVHNDYLELLLEGGLIALVLFAASVVVVLAAAWRSWRERPEQRHLTLLGLAVLAIAAAHSFVDYPIRSMALACLIGTGAGLLMRAPRKPASGETALDVGT